jgi:hypothetical protein
MGGSEFPVADTTGTGASTYWNSNGTTDVIASAKSYIPEQVWNDDLAEGQTSSGGGGVSIYTPRPTWQAGTFGGVAIPASTYRTVPDISLDASNYSAPLLFCSSDPSIGITGSCSNGFRDINNQYLTTAGGTSFDGPIFSGMLAMINQSLGAATPGITVSTPASLVITPGTSASQTVTVTPTASTGQGVINHTLYTLAANTTTYSSAFHDIVTAGNQCLVGSAACGTGVDTTDYPAVTGYDEASGLGSIDLYHLATAWPGYGTAPTGGFTGAVTFTVTASPTMAYACYALPGATVTGSAAATSTLTILTDQASCGSGYTALNKEGTLQSSNRLPASHGAPLGSGGVTMAGLFAGLCLAGLCFNRRKLSAMRGFSLVLFVLLGAATVGLSGCSSNAPATVPPTPANTTAAGTYTLTITGTSTANSSITSTTTVVVSVL